MLCVLIIQKEYGGCIVKSRNCLAVLAYIIYLCKHHHTDRIHSTVAVALWQYAIQCIYLHIYEGAQTRWRQVHFKCLLVFLIVLFSLVCVFIVIPLFMSACDLCWYVSQYRIAFIEQQENNTRAQQLCHCIVLKYVLRCTFFVCAVIEI